MQKLDSIDSTALQNRIVQARAEREALIVSLVEEEHDLLERAQTVHADRYDQVSSDLDALESEVQLCTRALNAREWARTHVRNGSASARNAATLPVNTYEPGFLTRMLLRCVLGPATSHSI